MALEHNYNTAPRSGGSYLVKLVRGASAFWYASVCVGYPTPIGPGPLFVLSASETFSPPYVTGPRHRSRCPGRVPAQPSYPTGLGRYSVRTRRAVHRRRERAAANRFCAKFRRVSQPASAGPSITTTDRKEGILSTLHSNLPTRLTAFWPCLPRSDFRSRTDQIEEASL